jgi:hypothetical protein
MGCASSQNSGYGGEILRPPPPPLDPNDPVQRQAIMNMPRYHNYSFQGSGMGLSSQYMVSDNSTGK